MMRLTQFRPDRASSRQLVCDIEPSEVVALIENESQLGVIFVGVGLASGVILNVLESIDDIGQRLANAKTVVATADPAPQEQL